MIGLEEHLRAVLVAAVAAHRVPNAQGHRSPLLHLRMGGMQQGIDHHAWPDDGPSVDREDLEALEDLGLLAITPQANSWAFRPTPAGYRLASELSAVERVATPGGDNQDMGIPTRRALLRWFHELEDDASRSDGVRDGFSLIQAARADGVIDAQDADGFAALVLQMADDDLINFDHLAREIDQFGADNPSRDLQQATDLRSTAKGRAWLRESAPQSAITFGEGATVGQVAGRDITNYVSFSQVLTAAETELDRIAPDSHEREDARNVLHALSGRATEVATGAGASLAARALAAALGLPA